MEIVELPSLQAEGGKLDDSPLQTTPAEPETHQLNLGHRTIEFTDAPKGWKAHHTLNHQSFHQNPLM